MKKIFVLNLLILSFLLFLHHNAKAQFDSIGYMSQTTYNENCFYLSIPTNTEPSEQFYKILIIYVTFWDDEESGPGRNIWKPHEKPKNYYLLDGRMIDPAKQSSIIPFMNRYSQYTYSDWFCQMSGGKFDFIGDEVHVELPLSSSEYRACSTSVYTLNNIALQLADPLVDYGDYDNWTGAGTFQPDNNVDFVVIQYRWVPNNDYTWFFKDPGVGGTNTIQTSITLDGKNISTGVTAIGLLNNTTHTNIISIHEICHYIFGGYFNHAGWNGNHVSMGMMTAGHGNSTYSFTPMEACMPGLDWMTPTVANPQNQYQDFNGISDYIENRDVIKVPIPNTSPQEYFWIGNTQKKSRFDGLFRGSIKCFNENGGEQDPFCDNNKGLFIFHESDRLCPNNVNGVSLLGPMHYAFDLKSADGRWNWTLDRTVYIPQFNGNFNLQKVTTSNSFWGVSEYYKYYLQSYPTWSAQLLTDKSCSEENDDVFITFDFQGDSLDVFNMGINEILSPYSNPSSNSYQSPNSNTGVTIKLKEQNPTTGEISIRVYFDDELALNECPPSKPKNLKVTKYDVEPDVSFYAKLNWDANIEPDFIYGDNSRYKIYRGEQLDCENEPTYAYLTSVLPNVTEYIDNSVLIFTGRIGGYNCGNQKKTVSYKISAVDDSEKESVKSDRALIRGYYEGCYENNQENFIKNELIPIKFDLHQNYPNPFNPVTNIKFDLPKDVFVTVKVYDLLGREIKTLVNEFKNAGSYLVSFNGSELASGIYFYRIQAGDFVQVKKMLMIK